MTCILITRPADDAQRLAERLSERGFDSLIEPMLDIAILPGPPPEVADIQALLFTSANGVRAFTRRTPWREAPVFAVGPATAEAARTAGFTAVETAEGDVDALASLVAARCRPIHGRLLHVAGTARAGDLSGALTQAGFTIDRAVLYEARPTTALSAACRDAWRDGRIGAVLFFSPRTARTFVRLIEQADIAERCDRVTAACLSQAVGAAARTGGSGPLPWRDLRIADRPEQDRLLALLDTLPG